MCRSVESVHLGRRIPTAPRAETAMPVRTAPNEENRARNHTAAATAIPPASSPAAAKFAWPSAALSTVRESLAFASVRRYQATGTRARLAANTPARIHPATIGRGGRAPRGREASGGSAAGSGWGANTQSSWTSSAGAGGT